MANPEEIAAIGAAEQQGNAHLPSLSSHVGDSLEGIGLTSEKALSKTGGAEISFFYFQKYEEELRKKNDEFVEHLKSQRIDFQKQLESEREESNKLLNSQREELVEQLSLERETSDKRLESQRKELVNQLVDQRSYWEKMLQTKEDKLKELNDSIVELSITNGFCRSLKWVNIIGAGLTLVGTTGASIAAANDKIGLVIVLGLVSILGALFPQIVTWISEGGKE